MVIALKQDLWSILGHITYLAPDGRDTLRVCITRARVIPVASGTTRAAVVALLVYEFERVRVRFSGSRVCVAHRHGQRVLEAYSSSNPESIQHQFVGKSIHKGRARGLWLHFIDVTASSNPMAHIVASFGNQC